MNTHQTEPSLYRPLSLGNFVTRDAFENATYQVTIGINPNGGMTQDEVIALFPKYCKAFKSGVSASTFRGVTAPRYETVVLNVSTATNEVTGEVNETGLKRRVKTLEILNANFSHLLSS
jgi:hypothetical protein